MEIDDPVVVSERISGASGISTIYFILVDNVPYIMNVNLQDAFGWKKNIKDTIRGLKIVNFKFLWSDAPTRRKKLNRATWAATPIYELVDWARRTVRVMSEGAKRFQAFVNCQLDFEASTRKHIQCEIEKRSPARGYRSPVPLSMPIDECKREVVSSAPIYLGHMGVEQKVAEVEPHVHTDVVAVKRKFDEINDAKENTLLPAKMTETLQFMLQTQHQMLQNQQRVTELLMELVVNQRMDMERRLKEHCVVAVNQIQANDLEIRLKEQREAILMRLR